MATQVQQRGGTTTEHSNFIGAAKELTVDTTKNTVVVHDGSTAGGIPLAKEGMGDGEKITFGNSDDLQIYHDGSHGRIRNSTGTLKIQSTANGENGIELTPDGKTAIFHDGVEKLATNLTGIDVLGTVTADDGFRTDVSNTSTNLLSRNSINTSTYIQQSGTGNILDCRYGSALAGQGTSAMVVASTGNVGIGTSNPSAYDSDADDLVIETAGNTGVTIKTSSTGKGNIFFADGTTGSERYRGVIKYDHSEDSMILATGAAERMRITSTGNVGIGVTPKVWDSSLTALQVGGRGALHATASQQTNLSTNVYANASNVWTAIATDEATMYQQDAGGQHVFFVAGSTTADTPISWTTALTIDNAGTTHWGTFSATGATSGCIQDTGAARKSSINGTGNSTHLAFYNPNGEVGSIRTSGSATLFNTSSDYRLKENVVPMSGSIDRLKELKPSRFNFITDADTTVDGFLAHEAQAIVPECVTGEKDAMRMEEYEVTPALGDVFTPTVEEVSSEQPVMETVEGDIYVNLAGETITETSEVGVTIEVTTTVIERQDIDGVMTEVEVEQVTQEPVMETVVTTEAVAEVLLESNIEKPETDVEGQQWRETTAKVTAEREVPDMQGIDQAKLVPLLVGAIQELTARLELLE